MQDWIHQRWKRLAHTLCAGLLATGLAWGATAPAVHAQDQEEASQATECPRGQGYWRTHSHRGPAPYDDTWATEDEIENGEEENGEPENGESESCEPENGENNGDESNDDATNHEENTVEATLSAEGQAGVVAGPETAEPNTLAPPFPSLFIPAVVAAP